MDHTQATVMRGLVAVALSLWAGCAAAAPEADQALSLAFSFGKLEPADNASLSGQNAEGGFGIDLQYRFRPRIAVAFDLEYHSQKADTPAWIGSPMWGSVDDTMSLATASMTFQGLYMAPLGPTRLQLGAGAGLFRSELRIGGSLLGIPGYFVDETDLSLGALALARWDVRLWNNWWLGAEQRRIKASANFGRWTEGDVEVGGVLNMITVRKQFDLIRWEPPPAAQP